MSNNLSLVALQEKINTLGPLLSSQNPFFLKLCFHEACLNENVTLEIVQLLHKILPEALRLRDNDGSLPIHRLCMNGRLDETNSMDILRFMLEIDPNLPRELQVDDDDYLPIHCAVKYKSTAFCKELIDVYPESLQVESDSGWLPIHIACGWGKRDDTVDTIQYMLELDPELINAAGGGYLPIHFAAENGCAKSIELLLKYDPNAASKKTYDFEQLPLHLASNLSSIQVLYDAYPDAVFASDSGGKTPVDLAREEGNQPAMEFLQTQLIYARQAQDMTAMTTVDNDG